MGSLLFQGPTRHLSKANLDFGPQLTLFLLISNLRPASDSASASGRRRQERPDPTGLVSGGGGPRATVGRVPQQVVEASDHSTQAAEGPSAGKHETSRCALMII